MGWPQNAYVGQKVVCVNSIPHPNDPCPYNNPEINKIYTIDKVYIVDGDVVMIELKEIMWKGNDNWYSGFQASFFRPVQSTEKGMEILRGLLNPKNHKNYKSKELVP